MYSTGVNLLGPHMNSMRKIAAVMPILQILKPRPRDIEYIVQASNKWQSQNVKPRNLISECVSQALCSQGQLG